MNHRISRRGFGRAALAALVSLPSAELRAESQQERGRRIVNEALAALGGDRYQSIRNRLESGRVYSFYRERLRGLAVARVYTRFLDQPKGPVEVPAQIVRESYGRKENQAVLYDAKGTGYVITYRGAKPLPDDRNTRYREAGVRNVMYILRARMKEDGLGFLSKGTDVIDNIPVELVDIYDAQNRTTSVAFQVSTRLPIRQTYDYRDPKTKDKFDEVVYFSKYRDVGGGVQWPFHVERQRNGEKVFEIFAESVEINQDLDESLFALPAGLGVLPKDKE